MNLNVLCAKDGLVVVFYRHFFFNFLKEGLFMNYLGINKNKIDENHQREKNTIIQRK